MGDLLEEVAEEEEVSVMKEGIVTRKGVVTKKKYKPVAKKVKPIIAELPGQHRIIRDIKGDPLENMPDLAKVPPPFTPKGWYTAEHKETLIKAHEDFLWVKEIKLMDHFMCEQNEEFAWVDSEKFPEDSEQISFHQLNSQWYHTSCTLRGIFRSEERL